MNNQPTTLSQMIIRNGLYAGGILVVYNLLVYVTGLNATQVWLAVLSFVVMVGVLSYFSAMTMKQQRNLLPEKTISFVQKFITGMLVILIGALMSSLFTFVLNNFIDPENMAQQFEAVISRLESSGLSDEMLDAMVDKVEEGMQPMRQFVSALTSSAISALLLGLIVAAFVKKNVNPFEK